MPLMALPVRSTFVKLGSGGVLISPGSQLTKDQLQKLVGVTDIVAPNLYHCGGLKLASSLFPKAKIWAPETGTVKKPEINWSSEIGSTEWPYQEEMPILTIRGMPKINETVFIHKKSKTLIVTDLTFNLLDAKGIGPWIILSLFGTYRKFGVSKFLLKYLEDKDQVERSLSDLFSFDFDNIVVSHGSNLFGGAKEALLKAFSERGLKPRI